MIKVELKHPNAGMESIRLHQTEKRVKCERLVAGEVILSSVVITKGSPEALLQSAIKRYKNWGWIEVRYLTCM
ncbi:hypothetical protein SAMN05421881_104033 [Nitrosomonas halophila]|uniref:Uncharacterized protein n=1 Tax=Nitrosomonas halophila TaxID=44576 RepID=A0A1H3KIU7_9PROT|nr:hypothetical protein SAMN05421881_104033 [Nitrosomonas halophila]